MAEPADRQFDHAPPAENAAVFDAVAELWARVADVDPISYYWQEPPEARAPAADGEDPEDSSPFSPGRRPLYKRAEPPPSAEEELAHVIAFLQRLRATVHRAAPPGDKAAPADPGQTVLQAKRLSRTGVAPDHFQIGVLPRPRPAPAAEAISRPVAQDPAPGLPPVPPPADAAPPQSAPPERRGTGRRVLQAGLLLALLGAGAYGWLRPGLTPHLAAASKGAPERAPAVHALDEEPSEEALNAVNLALEAMQRGDLPRASDLVARTQKQGTGLRGFFYQAALLAFNQGQAEQADNFLAESIAVNEAVADCWYLRANASFFSAGAAQAAGDFEQATHAAPFSPRYYFFRAECLRRNGNTAAALTQFQQALRCRPSSVDTELILFKIGLTKLESNTDLIFKTELRGRLSQEPVAGDTLLLATADAISRNEYAEAADDLKRAALVLPPRTFQSRMRDYVFRAQAAQPDIAAALKFTLSGGNAPAPLLPHGARTLVDPATRSLGEADPAGW